MIYATAFDESNKQVLDPGSVDSGFQSLTDVENVMGDGYIKKTLRMVIYKGVVFSDFTFYTGI